MKGQMGLPFETPDDVLLGRALLARFGSVASALQAGRESLLQVAGMSEAHAGALALVRDCALAMVREETRARMAVSDWHTAERLAVAQLRGRATEAFLVLFLDRKNGLIADEVMWEGTVDHVPAYPREVARRCLEVGASAVLVAHNHPSGDPTPSTSDIAMSERLQAALGALDITLHDSLIVGADRVVSLRAEGAL